MMISAFSNGLFSNNVIDSNLSLLGTSKLDTSKVNSNPTKSFKDVFMTALGDVNNLHNEADKAVLKMISEPSTVNIHEVTSLLSQAEMALSMTKVITDRVVHAYREITNLR